MPEPTTTLRVNGETIPLNEFVNLLFANVLKGMVSSLKGVDEPRSIEISVVFESEDE